MIASSQTIAIDSGEFFFFVDKMEKPSPSPTGLPNSSKRGPTCSLSGSSSSEGEGSDHEDIPPSPCSSTSSGPTYVRPSGFKHHGQEIKVEPRPKVNVRIKRKIKRQSMMKDILTITPPSHVAAHNQVTKVTSKEEKGGIHVLPPSGMKTKIRKDPIPMRLRALPQSFWQQPNTVNPASPGSMYSVLPPLCKMEQTNSDIAEVRPVSPSSDSESGDYKETQLLLNSDQSEAKELKERGRETFCDKDTLSIKLEKDKNGDLSRDRELSPRDREISPRDKEMSSPRERDLIPRDKELKSPRDRELGITREKDINSPRDREVGKDRELVREKEMTIRDLREYASGQETKQVQLPLEAKKKQPRPPPRIVRVSAANTELLAKLFEGIDGEGKKKMNRRGRPKREYNPQVAALAAAAAATNASNNNNNTSNTSATSTHQHPYLIGDDPYMIDSVAEGLLPMLSLESSRQNSGPSSQLSIVSIRGDNNRMLSLPSLSVEQNHSAILSELVKAL